MIGGMSRKQKAPIDDPAWDAPNVDAESTIATWTEAECEQAQTWARGYLGNVPRNVRRPEHTRLARGED